MKIAIHQDKSVFQHTGDWTNLWIDYCKINNIDFEIINCYQNTIIDKLKRFDCLLWHFGNYVLKDMLFARHFLNCAKKLGLNTFPDFNTSWHFDDKVAENFLLQSIGAPIPKSWIYFNMQDLFKDLDHELNFPLVAKLKSGSGSHNVILIKTKDQAIQYARKMFGKGINASPKVFFKAKSNISSSHSWKIFVERFKRIPEFINTKKNANQFPREKGYVYFQELIPNNGFDLKVIVIKDKLSYFARKVRKGDFRASGGADFFYNKSLVTPDILQTAFKISDDLNFQCMGFDYVVDKRTGKGVIIEMSYGFSHLGILQASGYWDKNVTWHNDPLNAPIQILKNLIKSN